MGKECKVPRADMDACEEAVLKVVANSFALKKEISSRYFNSSVLSFLCCSCLQRTLSRKCWQPTEKYCRWFWEKLMENSSFLWMSHVPLLITHPLQLSQSLPSLCLWSPRPSMSLEHLQFPTSHLLDSFSSWNSRFLSVLMLKTFPRWAEQLHLSPLLSPWFIQNSQIEQSTLCKCRIWPMAPHVFNGRLRDGQTDPVIM